MAIGIALVLGYHLVPNFDAPYQSASITEFWRRWHISLSTWLRDYLYIPLGGNRLGKIRTYINLLITMLLGGLWHGASMQFVLWGFLHGTALSLEKFFNINSTQRSPLLLHILRVLLTYHFVCFCWIFFRAATFQAALDVLYQIAYDFRPELIGDFIHGYYRVLVFMALGFAFHFVPKSIEQRVQNAVTYLPLLGKALLLVAIIFCVMQVKSSEIQPFIYFQF
jgi:D-alanyl-lipoteichoic acid acyltransferase DltB (MBOAT superfamily)